MSGRPLEATDRTLLTAYAAHFAVIRERQRAAADSRQRAQLVEGNRTRTALLAAVSHDLRSPLAAIKAAISSLRGGTIAWSPEDEAELLATIEESADRLDALVGNLLDMSRLQMGTVKPLLAEIDLGAAVDQAIRPIAGSDRIAVKISDDLPPAVADAGLLDRVLANIVENALRYTPIEVGIDITAAPFQDESGREWVSLRIVDHGPGVSEDGKETLFAPFQRLGDVPRGDGIGLGLAVARGLTEVMHGELSAEDTPGGGLTMVVDLPAAVASRNGGPGEADHDAGVHGAGVQEES
jgi:two-component system sensor histidine kinase KdpD